MTHTISPTLRKAALLVRSLDGESAAVLLAQLSPEEAKTVRLAIRELGTIDPDEQAELRDSLRRPAAVERIVPDTGGVELDLNRQISFDESVPFAWLDGGDLPSLAAVLEREHLSTVAVVLSYLPPHRASALLEALPPGRRAAALERLADLGESDRASLEVIEKGLADWLRQQKAEQRRRADRLGAVEAILSHSPLETRNAVLAEIASRDGVLAGRLKAIQVAPAPSAPLVPARRVIATQAASLSSPRGAAPSSPVTEDPPIAALQQPARQTVARFDFEELHQLTRSDIATLFRHCRPDSLVMALAGASERVTNHVTSQLPRKMAKELHRRIHQLSAIRMSDVTAAQEQLGEAVARLIAGGQLPRKLAAFVQTIETA